MKLTYRGVAYEFIPQLIESVSINISVKYRSQNYSLRRPVCHFNPSPLNLKYRGVAYSTVPTDKVPQVSDMSKFIPSYL